MNTEVVYSIWIDMVTFLNARALQTMRYFVYRNSKKNTRKAVLMLKLYMTSYTFSLATKPSKLPYAKDTKGCDFLGTVLGNPVRISL